MNPPTNRKQYICIDLKSYYASVECVRRGLDPLRAKLLVADETRSDQTICLAVSPALKAIGVPSRPRLFEAKEAIRRYEITHHTTVDYIIAPPHMADYEQVSAAIYGVYLRYAAPEDIHVYSIDEAFIDCTAYLHLYQKDHAKAGIAPAKSAAAISPGDISSLPAASSSPAHLMARTILRDVLATTGITATVGIGTNMYLAKIAMDIVAKKQPPDEDGVRIAALDEESYRILLWEHRPLTDFWQIGRGKSRRLQKACMFTMGDIAARSQIDEEWFYKTFGIDGEILIDHAWGIEPVTMADIKGYHSDARSLSAGQVLPRPYEYCEARLVLREMIDGLCSDMFAKNLIARTFTWYVGYDYKSLEKFPSYAGPISMDFYGRIHPRRSNGTARLPAWTNSVAEAAPAILRQFDQKTDRRLLYRRLAVCACDTQIDEGIYQMDLFTDFRKRQQEQQIQGAMLNVRRKYGPNAVFKGMNLCKGGTALERNEQIGGHRK